MRIALNGFYWGQPSTGSGQYVRQLVRAMARLAPENEYLIVVPRSPQSPLTRGAQGGLVRDEIIALPDISPRVFLYPERAALQRVSENLSKVDFEQNAFPRACARERVDIAHVPYFASPLNPPSRTVVTIHDLIPLILPSYRGGFLVRRYTDLVAMSARRAHAVIADSDCSQRDVVTRLGILPERVRTIYLAADARFKPSDDTAALAAFRARYELPEKYLLYLGGYDQRKNVSILIEAFSLLPELYKAGYRLVLGGISLGVDSEFFPDPRRIAQQIRLPDDAIRYLGWVREEDKALLYASAELFLFPSLYEGFGLPPLEAMACGTPVIASSASSLPEIAGDAALLVEPEAAIAWAESIRAVVNDASRLQQMRERGIAQAKKFSWERAARETLQVYEGIKL